MNTFRGEGKRIKWTNNTGAALASSAVVALAGLIGVLVTGIANAVAGMLEIAGVHELPATSAEAWAQGTPVYWNASTGKLTQYANRNTYAGTAAKAKEATKTTAMVKLNEGVPLPSELLNRLWEDVTDDKTLDAQDVGKVLNVTVDAKTITLPATAAGLEYVIRCGGTDATVGVAISPNAADKIMGADLAGTDNVDRLLLKATAKQGDFIVLKADGSAGWYVTVERGTWSNAA